MKLFACTDHNGVWLGTASIVLANSEEEARQLLGQKFDGLGLYDDVFTLTEISMAEPRAIILWDGDY